MDMKKIQVPELLKIILWGVLVLSPLFMGVLLSIITKSKLGNLDAWYTSWNDEVHYYRSVVLMRDGLFPAGNPGYNEVLSQYPAYGPYNYLTYFPYVLWSFLTGVSSHNFMVAINILMLTASYALLVVLLRPSITQSVLLTAFSLTHLVFARYVWSGMSEIDTVAMLIIVTACVLWLLRKRDCPGKKWSFIFICQLAVLSYACLLRPFLLVYFMLEFVLIFLRRRMRSKKRNAVYCVCLLLLLLALLLLWYWMEKKLCTPFLEEYSLKVPHYIDLLKNGKIVAIVTELAASSAEAYRSIFELLPAANWIAVIPTEAVGVCLLGVVAAIICFRKTDKLWGTLYGISAVSIFLIMEAAVTIDYWWVVYRFMLCPIMVGTLFFIFGGRKKQVASWLPAILNEGMVIVLMAYLLTVTGSYSLKLPVTGQYNEEELQEIGHSFESSMPYDFKDHWGNTMAMLPWDNDQYLLLAMPLYVTKNTCTRDYLAVAVTNDTLKSRYVFIHESEEEFLSLLEAKGYGAVWDNLGYRVYTKAGGG